MILSIVSFNSLNKKNVFFVISYLLFLWLTQFKAIAQNVNDLRYNAADLSCQGIGTPMTKPEFEKYLDKTKLTSRRTVEKVFERFAELSLQIARYNPYESPKLFLTSQRIVEKSSGKRKSVNPDFAFNQRIILIEKKTKVVTYDRTYNQLIIMEAKALNPSNSNINPRYDNYQIGGMFEILDENNINQGGKFAPLRVRPIPIFILISLKGTKIGPELINLGNQYKILVAQMAACYVGTTKKGRIIGTLGRPIIFNQIEVTQPQMPDPREVMPRETFQVPIEVYDDIPS